jgi:hypothetical protein
MSEKPMSSLRMTTMFGRDSAAYDFVAGAIHAKSPVPTVKNQEDAAPRIFSGRLERNVVRGVFANGVGCRREDCILLKHPRSK